MDEIQSLAHGFIVALSFKNVAFMFVVFDLAFDVIMPKGPLEALLGR